MKRIARTAQLLGIIAFALLMTQSAAVTLAQTHDSYRQVLIFAPAGDPRLQQQIETLQSHSGDLIDRQVMLVPFYRNFEGPVDREIISLRPEQELSLRKRFHVAQDAFTVILIGKDGGEKLRSIQPLSFEKLRDTIDSMPMRRQEVRSRPKL